jgi:hypothetical protein
MDKPTWLVGVAAIVPFAAPRARLWPARIRHKE